MPMARMRALLRWLPHDAAVWVGTPMAWTVERELMATTVELLGELLRAVMASGGVKRSRLPKPIKVPRPDGLLAQAQQQRPTKFDPYRFTAWLASVSPKAA